jgi:2-polyprenyl-3-methyl-5-hydroxy-6-metoxy-1,4-benzoquinol methylase
MEQNWFLWRIVQPIKSCSNNLYSFFKFNLPDLLFARELLMSQRVHYTNCPVCGAAGIEEKLIVTDFTVSNEKFPVALCHLCTAMFTQDIPAISSIGAYYKSEEYISHTNTSRGLINQLYQTIRKRTIRQKRKLIENLTGLKEGSLLDVGSGTGVFAAAMQQHGWQVTGLEPDPDARKVASEANGIELGDISNFYELPNNYYDAITLWHVLEHVHDLQGYLAKFKSLLKGKGKLFIAVPNYTCKDAAVYREYWAAWDVPRHLYHFSPASMKKLVEKHGMRIEAYKPMWYDSFYVSMLSSRYRSGKTRLFESFFTGLRSNWKALGNVQHCSSVIYIISH